MPQMCIEAGIWCSQQAPKLWQTNMGMFHVGIASARINARPWTGINIEVLAAWRRPYSGIEMGELSFSHVTVSNRLLQRAL